MKDLVLDKIWLTDTDVWIRTTDGREASEKFADYQRLKFATPKQRANFTINEFGIRWEELDEDLSFEGFFYEKKSNPLYDIFITYPELNAAAIARRLGMSQSLFALFKILWHCPLYCVNEKTGFSNSSYIWILFSNIRINWFIINPQL